MPKKQAVVMTISKMTKLLYKNTNEELEASVKSDVQVFFKKPKLPHEQSKRSHSYCILDQS